MLVIDYACYQYRVDWISRKFILYLFYLNFQETGIYHRMWRWQPFNSQFIIGYYCWLESIGSKIFGLGFDQIQVQVRYIPDGLLPNLVFYVQDSEYICAL